MAATAYELQTSRAIRFAANNPGTSFEFIVVEAAEDDIAAVLQPLCPQVYQGYVRQPWSATPRGGVWEASVPYGVSPGTGPALFPDEELDPDAAAADQSFPNLDSPDGYDDPFADYPEGEGGEGESGPSDSDPLGAEYSFTTVGGTRTVRHALVDKTRGGTTSHYYARAGEVATSFAGAVGVRQGGDNRYEVEGIDTPEPKLDFTTTRNVGFLDRKAVRKIARLTASVNKTKAGGFEAGELLFLGADGQYKPGGGWSVTFHFAVSPNIVSPVSPPAGWPDGEAWLGVEVADGLYIPPGETKEGWDLIDVMFEEKAIGGRMLPRAKQFAVHRIFPRADFKFLGLTKTKF